MVIALQEWNLDQSDPAWSATLLYWKYIRYAYKMVQICLSAWFYSNGSLPRLSYHPQVLAQNAYGSTGASPCFGISDAPRVGKHRNQFENNILWTLSVFLSLPPLIQRQMCRKAWISTQHFCFRRVHMQYSKGQLPNSNILPGNTAWFESNANYRVKSEL